MLLLVAASWACEPLDLEAAKSSASTQLAEGDAAGALATVRSASGRLGCTGALADPVTLSLLFQVGVAASGTDQAQRREFANDAVRLGPGVSCRAMFGASTCQEIEAARVAAENGPRGRVLAQGEVWLDGVRLAAGAERSVAAGRHLVQRFDEAARVIPEEITVAPDTDTRVGVTSPPAAAASPPRSPLRVPLAVGGAALALGGGACLAAAFFDAHAQGKAGTIDEADNATYNLLVYGGLVGVGLGAGAAVTSSLVAVGPGTVVIGGHF